MKKIKSVFIVFYVFLLTKLFVSSSKAAEIGTGKNSSIFINSSESGNLFLPNTPGYGDSIPNNYISSEWFERIYKIILPLLIVIITIIGVVIYIKNNKKKNVKKDNETMKT